MDDRRSTDAIIRDMHGMLMTLAERMNNHLSWDEAHHKEEKIALLGFDERLKPVEDFQKVFRDRCLSAGRVVGFLLIVMPTLASIAGGLFWFAKRFFLAIP